MEILSRKNLADITGGTSKNVLWIVFGGAITFIIGFIEGIINPIKCRNH